MSERIIELLHRNLQEVFGEGDAVRRRAAIDQFYIRNRRSSFWQAKAGRIEEFPPVS